MAIVHMARTREEVPAHGVNARDVTADWLNYVAEEARATWTLFTYETHVGLCLEERERNGHDDSDFYMIVWNEEKQAPESIEFASTRGWSYPCYGSKADATPEIRAKYDAYVKEAERKARVRNDIERSTLPFFGRDVRVVRGRKIPIGTEGDVFWMSDLHRPHAFAVPRPSRIGVRRFADGTRFFIDAKNVEVINPDRYREIKD